MQLNMEIIVLKCPQCGAHLESNRTICEHCGSAVRLSDDKQQFIGTGVSCPNCGTNNNVGDKHCGSCGAKLIAICPVPNCHEENNIWRKFCKKCGKNIIGYHIELLETEQAKFSEELKYHTDEIDRIQSELDGSKGREIGVKLIILLVGIVISLAFLSGKNGWIGALITMVIIGIIAGCYHSSEQSNLLNSLALHQEDKERIQESYESNHLKLERIKQV